MNRLRPPRCIQPHRKRHQPKTDITFPHNRRHLLFLLTHAIGCGSAFAAFTTSPPAALAICAINFFEITDHGFSTTTSTSEAYRSLCLINSHCLSEDAAGAPGPFVRTNTHDPFSLLPLSLNFSSPSRNAP